MGTSKIIEFIEQFSICGCVDMIPFLTEVKAALEKPEYMPDPPALVFILDGAGYLEHGTSARGSWRTMDGDALLAEINTFLSTPEVDDD